MADVASHGARAARTDPAPRRRDPALADRRYRAPRDDGGGQDAHRDADRSRHEREHLRVVRRGRSPRLRARPAAAVARRPHDRRARAGGPGSGLRALELPARQSGPQARGSPGRRLHLHPEARRGSAGFGACDRCRAGRGRRTAGCHRYRVRRAGRGLGAPDRLAGDPQDLVHRARCRSASSS